MSSPPILRQAELSPIANMILSFRSVHFCLWLSIVGLASPVMGQKLNAIRSGATASNPKGFADRPIVAKDAPMLGVTVRVPSDMAIPDELKKFEITQGKLANPRLKIGAENQSDIQAVLSNPDLHVELERPKAFTPVLEIAPDNLDARISHLVPEFYAAFPTIRGKSINVAIFDEGRIRETHQEFQDSGVSRIKVVTMKLLARHSTHCAGTVGALGVELQATGMATQTRILSYDWDNDVFNLNHDAQNFQVSSHSYGPRSGWVANYPKASQWNWWGGWNDDEDSRYGKYTDECSQLDEALANHPHVLTFFAAGNDRGAGPRTQPTTHYVVSTGTYSSKARPRTGSATGLDSVSGSGLAKNAVCIGAIDDIPAGGGINAIQITSFSGMGPADDGRIKPDLVANGFQLFSTSDAANDAYVEMSGTSMATPTSAGIGALMWELYKQTNNRNPTAAELKAALIHTARDGGVIGPDPQYGWGSIDSFAAGQLIAGKRGKLIDNPTLNTVNAGATKTYRLIATGEPIRATLVWTDPQAEPNGGGVDEATTVLQNDLDVTLTSPNGTSYLPYSLDLANLWNSTANVPTVARANRANRVDNVEVIDAPGAVGEWKISVTGFNLKVGSSQSFALAVAGLKQSDQ